MIPNQFLSPHFSLLEMTESRTAKKHGIVNEAPPEAVENLKRLCDGTLEPLREKLGLPIIITSGFRCQRLNDILSHSSKRSQHMEGRAADFYISSAGFKFEDAGSKSKPSHRELLIQAFRLIILEEGIDFDQLILYPSFIHVSYVSREKNRRKLTKANGQGTYCAVTRADALALK